MELILLRHGKTPSAYEAGVASDYERPLGELGKDQAKRAGKYLASSGLTPERILSSPVLRARQTAERALKGLGKAVPLQNHAQLEPGVDTAELLKSLGAYAKESPLLLVGHMPDIGMLAALLAFGPEAPGLDLKPGGMVCVKVEDLSGRANKIRWLLQPDQIENLV